MLRRTRLYSDTAFWLSHAAWPLLAFAGALGVIAVFDLDRRIAGAWYFDSVSGWLGGGAGDWWAHRLLHDTGRWLVRGVAAAALLCWLLGFAWQPLRARRRDAAYVFVAMALGVAVVGLLKCLSNVDCPWDLAEFGGDRPYVAPWAGRPDYLPRGQCFPGAHAASGFALLCFYFLLRDRSARLARSAFAAALAVGAAFSIGQEARGAHFLSHDLAGAAVVWFVQLAAYGWMLKPDGTASDRPARQQGSGSGALCLRGLASEQQQGKADHDQCDADAHADIGAPIVDPAQHREFTVQVLEQE